MKLISSLSTRSGTVRPRLGRLLTASAVLTGAVVLVLPAQTAAAASPASRDCVDTNGPWVAGPCGDRPGDLERREAEATQRRVQQEAADARRRDLEEAADTRRRVQQEAEDTRRHSHGPRYW